MEEKLKLHELFQTVLEKYNLDKKDAFFKADAYLIFLEAFNLASMNIIEKLTNGK